MYDKPELGRLVAVTTLWHDDVIVRQLGRTERHYRGVVISPPIPDWNDPTTFCLRTDNRAHPISLIDLRRVGSLRYLDTDEEVRRSDDAIRAATETRPKNAPDREYIIDGSTGNKYRVTFQKGQWSCTCAGFGFRRTCAHVKKAKELEEAASQ